MIGIKQKDVEDLFKDLTVEGRDVVRKILGRTWHEIRHKETGKIVFSSDDESESQSRLKDCWPVGEYELVTVREIKK